ncbi:hypothetical protein ACFWAA_15925 [Streptomyces sp. NPDC059922]|uniref:hypothetical protein n=1 Tax=Streptomyces sp. NPDC059922 TaxID=3347005 RepID=UPI00364604FD
MEGISELGEPVHHQGGLVQRGVVESEDFWPAVVDLMGLQPPDAPGRGLRDAVVVEEAGVGQQSGQAEGDEPCVLATTAFGAGPRVLRDGAGEEVEPLANRLSGDAGGPQNR